MSRKTPKAKIPAHRELANAVEEFRQSADPTRGVRDAISTAQHAVKVVRDRLGLDDLKKSVQVFDPTAEMRRSMEALARGGQLPDLDAFRTASGLKATDLAKFATFNRKLGLDDLPTVLAPDRLVRGSLDIGERAMRNRGNRQSDSAKAEARINQLAKIATAKDIGQLVRTAREARDLSQQSFADLAGVGRRFISELENGKASLEFDKVLKVAAAAGIDVLAKPR